MQFLWVGLPHQFQLPVPARSLQKQTDDIHTWEEGERLKGLTNTFSYCVKLKKIH